MTHVVYIILNHDTRQAYAGLTRRFSARISDHRKRKPYLFTGRHEVLKTELMSAAAAQEKEAEAVRYLQSIGFHTVNVAKPGGLGAPAERIWTKERCSAELSKFGDDLRAFRLGAPEAYSAAQRNGWLAAYVDAEWSSGAAVVRLVGRQPVRDRKPSNRLYWTKERCAFEALKYATRGEFSRNAASAYGAAFSKGWLDEICAHMPRDLRRRVVGWGKRP